MDAEGPIESVLAVPVGSVPFPAHANDRLEAGSPLVAMVASVLAPASMLYREAEWGEESGLGSALWKPAVELVSALAVFSPLPMLRRKTELSSGSVLEAELRGADVNAAAPVLGATVGAG
jgi:hypothetical protein